MEPRDGGFPDFHHPVAGRVLPRAEAVHGRRDGRRRQGLTPDFSPIRWRVSVDRGALFPYEIGNGGLPG